MGRIETKRCGKCRVTQPITEFHRNKNKACGYSNNCKVCSKFITEESKKNQTPESREITRIHKARYMGNYKKMWVEVHTEIIARAKDVPCTDCGGRFPKVAMDFDHVRGEKKFNVGRLSYRPHNVLLEEIAKCEVVCANCHRIRTYNRWVDSRKDMGQAS